MDFERNEFSDFLKKTYEMVDDPSTDSIISWSPDGRAFIVWMPEECKRDLLPKYLQVKAFGRFDYYGFRRIVSTKEQLVIDCKGFVRGKPELLDQICERHLAQLQASRDKIYKPLEDRLNNCKNSEDVELVRKENREMLNKEIMEQKEAFQMMMAASRQKAQEEAVALEAKAAAIEAKAAAALAIEDQHV